MRPIIAVMVVSLLVACPAGCGRSVPTSGVPAATQSPVRVAIQSKPREANAEERERYAAREKQSAGLEKFEGGAGVVTVLLIVVLVIVILILLKKI